jgi:hypothetical protein
MICVDNGASCSLNGRMLVRVSDDRADAERLDELTTALRRELLDLGVGEVRRVSEGQPPEGARAVDAATVNALLVGLTHSIQAVTAVVTLVRSWVDVTPAAKRSVELTLGDKTLQSQLDLAGAAGPAGGGVPARGSRRARGRTGTDMRRA